MKHLTLTNFVLQTAAHCTNGYSASAIRARAGSRISNSGGVQVRVAAIYQHKSYNNNNLDYDFALLKLAATLIFDSNIRAIRLPGMNENVVDGSTMQISGWGDTQNPNESSVYLRGVLIPSVSQGDCQRNYGNSAITPRMICAGFKSGGKILSKKTL